MLENDRSIVPRGAAPGGPSQQRVARYPHGHCPLCRRTRGCWTSFTGRTRKRPRGHCTQCGRGPRDISYRHPRTRTAVCQTCSWHLRGRKQHLRRGPCPDCPSGRGDRILQYCDEDRQAWLCKACFFRLAGRNEKRRKKECQRCRIVSRHVAVRKRFHELLCDVCFNRRRGRRRPRPSIATCPNCSRPSRGVRYRHDGVRWCLTCHRAAVAYTLPRGQCFECGNWRQLSRRHWRFDLLICRSCFDAHKAQTRRLVA